MSLILDALKKSAQKKSAKKSPDLLTAHIGAARQQPAGRPRWIPYLIITALLLNAVVLAAWLIPRSSENATATTTKQEIQPIKNSPIPAPQEATVKPVPEPQVTPSAQTRTEKQEQARRMVPVSAPEVAAPPPAPASKPAPVERKIREARIIEKSQPESVPVPPPPQGIVGISELPSSVRRSLPEMSMSAHVYTPEKDFRLVQIQGKTLREGQSLSPGLVLDEVTIDGAVFRYKGYRFSLKMF